MADTFFWGSDIISRATRWLLINTGTTFNLLLPLLLILLGLALGQIHSSNYLSCLLLIKFLYFLFSIFVVMTFCNLVVAFFSALGVGGLSSLGMLDRTEQAGTSMLQVKFSCNEKTKGRRFTKSLQSAATNTENILERAGQASRNLVRQGGQPGQNVHLILSSQF